MSDTISIDIEFTNGRLRGVGRIQLKDSESVGVNEDGSIRERSSSVLIDIHEGEIFYEDESTATVEPGRYIVTGEGLFREVDAPAH